MYVTSHDGAGNSGRIVIEMDTALNAELCAALSKSNSTLKDGFVATALQYCKTLSQPDLFSDATETAPSAPRTGQLP